MNISTAGLLTANAGISSAQTITITNSASQLYFSDGTTSTCGIRWSDDNHGVFCQRNANVMYIKEYGDIYFQTTGSATRAHVNMNGIYVPSASATTSVQIGITRSGYPNEPMILLRSGNNANNRGFIGHSGSQLYAWCTSNSNGEPSGGYNYVAVGGGWGYSSDRRLKADIKTLECGDCCEKLLKLNCCSYYWKTDEKKEKKNCGFIADEVKKIFPEFVETTGMKIGDDENIEGIEYTSFIPILVSAFQHITEKVDNLEKENKILLNIIQDLTNQLAEIRAVVFPPNAP